MGGSEGVEGLYCPPESKLFSCFRGTVFLTFESHLLPRTPRNCLFQPSVHHKHIYVVKSENTPFAPGSPGSSFLTCLRQVHLPAPGKWGQPTGDATAGRDAVLKTEPVTVPESLACIRPGTGVWAAALAEFGRTPRKESGVFWKRAPDP